MTAPLRVGRRPTDELLPGELLDRVQRRQTAADVPVHKAAAVAAAVRSEMGGLISDATLLRLIRAVQQELVGAGPLTELLADPLTTDVVVNGPDDVRVDRGAGWEAVPISFSDDAGVQRLARRLAAAADRRLDDAQPFVDAQLGAGVRLHAVLAPVAASGSCVSLRVLRPAAFDLTALASRGSFGPGMEAVLRRVVAARLAVLVSGGTGSGKTTLLAALLAAVAPSERVVIVEDAAELQPAHPHTIRLVCRSSNVEGAGRIELRELVRQALRMRPDRIVVGEVRGPEIADLLVALNTGHRGGAGTVHANTAADVPSRLVALAALAGMPEAVLNAQLAAAVQVLVHVTREVRAGEVTRRVREIAVLETDDAGRVVPRTAYFADGRAGPGAARLSALIDACD